jgi:hypothetical protein
LTVADAKAIQSLITDIDGDATCTGSAANPTAPAGKICFYIAEQNEFESFSVVAPDRKGGVGTGGAFIFAEGTVPAEFFAQGSFAITAPEAP